VNRAWTRVETADGGLRVQVVGRGPALLLIHGLTANGAIWHRLIERLEDRFTLIVPDLLGRGGSDAAPRARFRLEQEAARIERVAAVAAPGPFVAVGHSQGAALALTLASRADRCRALCLLDPVTPWTARPAILELLRPAVTRRLLAPLVPPLRRTVTRHVLRRRVFGDPAAVDEAAIRRYAEPYGDPERARTLLRVLADWRPGDLSPHLPPRPPAALVLTGERDRRAPPDLAARLAERLACPIRVVPRAGHALPEEAPAEITRAIDMLTSGGSG
jgi:magnesium chelatase accessory protein